ncbi:hypothetical protein PMIN03_001275 [Paraphaeosphaeria minitans]
MGSRFDRVGQYGKSYASYAAVARFVHDIQGTVIGPPLGNELRKEYGQDLQIEGINYAALLSTNYLPGGTDLVAELEMRGILNDINRRCPQAVIVSGGYS